MTSSNVACDKISNNYLNLALTYGMAVCRRHVTLASVPFCTILLHGFIFSQLNVSRSVTIQQDVHLLSGIEGARTWGSHSARRLETNLKNFDIKYAKIATSGIFEIIFSKVMYTLFAFLTKNTDYNFTQTCCLCCGCLSTEGCRSSGAW